VTSDGVLTGIDDVRAPLGNPPSGAPLRLRRRELLLWGGAAALWPALARPAQGQAAAAAAAAGADVVRPMSVGFVDGSDTWRGFRAITAGALNRGIRREAGRPAEPAKVVPATSLIAFISFAVGLVMPRSLPLLVRGCALSQEWPCNTPLDDPLYRGR